MMASSRLGRAVWRHRASFFFATAEGSIKAKPHWIARGLAGKVGRALSLPHLSIDKAATERGIMLSSEISV